ncbi:MAG TPA: hypothetical protein VE890_17720, partial [Thermoguttaceae bacterium]|nr:hypothetical protein [Thermoguttaceae bacterium]
MRLWPGSLVMVLSLLAILAWSPAAAPCRAEDDPAATAEKSSTVGSEDRADADVDAEEDVL